jgi:nucleotide-binding universal stress UspA family protein
MYRCILVCLDGSAGDGAVVEYVAELARLHGSRVVLIRVGTAGHWDAVVREAEQIETYLAGIRDDLAQRGLAVQTVVGHGDPAKTILEQADAMSCDLIAMSSHGHRWLMDLLLGSVSSAVKHGARVPVLLLPGEPTDR